MATIEELAAKVAGLEQQMAAITVPPTEYYTSIFSGEDIDAAIKKVNDGIVGGVSSFNGRTGAVKPQAGDYNATQIPVSGEPKAETVAAALSNKAPAGYGLGAAAAPVTDLNQAVLSGWYSCAGSSNGPSSNFYGWLLVSSRTGAGGMIRQDAWNALGQPDHFVRLDAPILCPI